MCSGQFLSFVAPFTSSRGTWVPVHWDQRHFVHNILAVRVVLSRLVATHPILELCSRYGVCCLYCLAFTLYGILSCTVHEVLMSCTLFVVFHISKPFVSRSTPIIGGAAEGWEGGIEGCAVTCECQLDPRFVPDCNTIPGRKAHWRPG